MKGNKLYISCMCFSQCVCMRLWSYMFVSVTYLNGNLFIVMLLGLCMGLARVKCVWETAAQLKYPSLMGMTLPSAVQTFRVGKFVFVSFLCCYYDILSGICFFLSCISALEALSLSLSMLHQRAYLYCLLLTILAPRSLQSATAYKCHSSVTQTLGDPMQRAPNLSLLIMHSQKGSKDN